MFKTSIKIVSILLILFSNGHLFAQEIKVRDSLKRLLVLEHNPEKKMDVLLELSELIQSTNSDLAIKYANQVVDISIESDNIKYKLQAWLQLAEIYWDKDENRLSLELANNVKVLASDLKLDKEYAESLILIAKNLSNFGDFKKSAALNFQALSIFEKLGDRKGVGEAYNRIGYDYYQQEIHDKALEYYIQSLEISRGLNDIEGISRGLNNVAIVYASHGESLSAKANFKESVEINKGIDRDSWVAINYLNLGVLYKNEKKYDTAFYYLKRSVRILTELNSLQKLPNVYYALSTYYKEIEKLDSSLYYAELCYQISRETGQKKKSQDAAIQLSTLYQKQGDFEGALNYSTIENQLKDSLAANMSMARISHLELLYEYEKAEQEKRITQQRHEYSLIVVSVVIVFVLLMLVVIISVRNRLKTKNEEIERRQLNQKLEVRNKELATNVITLIRRNEILSGLGDKLMTIKSNAAKEETKVAINKIAKKLQESSDNDIWDEFEVRFKQVHGDFYEKLVQQFPDLSPNEHRLCAFLRLNMSSKEISELTGQRVDTLEIARWRLRKKLKITNTKINLVTFLSKI